MQENDLLGALYDHRICLNCICCLLCLGTLNPWGVQKLFYRYACIDITISIQRQALFLRRDTMETTKVSRKLLQRLPIYLNHLRTLPEDSDNVSATAIAAAVGLGHVQVRKDLAKVSEGGRCRVGRSREKLIRDIENYLDYVSPTGTIIVGAGKLGQALLDYGGFEESGLNVMAGFDIAPAAQKTGTGKPIYSMSRLESFCRCYNVQIGIIAVPAENAQTVCDTLVTHGIHAIWNFAPVNLKVPDYVTVQSENLAVSLATLRTQIYSREQLKS